MPSLVTGAEARRGLRSESARARAGAGGTTQSGEGQSGSPTDALQRRFVVSPCARRGGSPVALAGRFRAILGCLAASCAACTTTQSVGDAQDVYAVAELTRFEREALGEWHGVVPSGTAGIPDTAILLTLRHSGEPKLLSYQVSCPADSCALGDIYKFLFGVPPGSEDAPANQFGSGTVQVLAFVPYDGRGHAVSDLAVDCVLNPQGGGASLPVRFWLSEEGDELRVGSPGAGRDLSLVLTATN